MYISDFFSILKITGMAPFNLFMERPSYILLTKNANFLIIIGKVVLYYQIYAKIECY